METVTLSTSDRSPSQSALSAPVDHLHYKTPSRSFPWTVPVGSQSPCRPQFEDIYLERLPPPPPTTSPRKNSLDQLPQPHQQEEDQKESDKGSESDKADKEPKEIILTLGSVFQRLRVRPTYVYECDCAGRVKGERLSLQDNARKYDRLLVVAQHAEHLFHLRK